jgi:hypothetical protein
MGMSLVVKSVSKTPAKNDQIRAKQQETPHRALNSGVEVHVRGACAGEQNAVEGVRTSDASAANHGPSSALDCLGMYSDCDSED